MAEAAASHEHDAPRRAESAAAQEATAQQLQARAIMQALDGLGLDCEYESPGSDSDGFDYFDCAPV